MSSTLSWLVAHPPILRKFFCPPRPKIARRGKKFTRLDKKFALDKSFAHLGKKIALDKKFAGLGKKNALRQKCIERGQKKIALADGTGIV